MPAKKQSKTPSKPRDLKSRTLTERKATKVKGGRAGGDTQSEDDVYVGLR